MHGWEEMRIRYSGSHGLRCGDGMVWYVMLCRAMPCSGIKCTVQRDTSIPSAVLRGG